MMEWSEESRQVSAGWTGALALKLGKCGRYVGVELVEHAAEIARANLTQVIHGNIEAMELPWPESTFDALLLSEVLEHLTDPWAVLNRLIPLLRHNAVIVASVPNVAHIKIISELCRGRWDLTDSGPKDRTHLRWFTPKTFRAMFENAGLQVIEIGPSTEPGRKGRLFNALTANRFSHLTIRQIRLVAKNEKRAKASC